jgi:hypothetical protein
MFKEKTSKKRIATHNTAKDTSTLDARHQTVISSLQSDQSNIKTLRTKHNSILKDIKKLESSIKEFKINDNTECDEYNLLWSSNVLLRELKKSLEDTITKVESADDEIEYFENTGNILFKYYDLIEQQNNQHHTLQEVSTMTQQQRPSVKGRKKLAPPASLTILDALCFGGKSKSSSDLVSDSNISEALINDVNQSKLLSPKSVPKVIDKSSLVDEYLAQVDLTHVKAKNHDALGCCPRCELQLTCIHQDGAMVCSECGYQELLLIEQNRPLIRQPNKEASHYSYKRINHFREWCSQVQGKESTDIPEEIFENILQEIKKEKIQDMRKITYNKMREIMKRLRINKFYEHINYIINRINGVPTPHFSPELEEKLCSMFKEIQGPFLKHCPKERKNFLSYSYVLFKFFQILNKHEYLRFFPLLKSREKLWVQDQIFKNICEDLNWPFVPSL